jgi:UDP-N-acetylglucosamine 2-epimerase
MRNATVMVGNSSSGLIEAPCFGLPVVNIGRRQEGRECSSNVIHVPCQREKIINAIRKAQSPSFIKQSRKVTNPYGDGKSSKKIVDILSSIKIDDELLFKKLRY